MSPRRQKLRCNEAEISVCITVPNQAKRDAAVFPGSRGNALSRGPLTSFLLSKKRGHNALTLHSESCPPPMLLLN